MRNYLTLRFAKWLLVWGIYGFHLLVSAQTVETIAPTTSTETSSRYLFPILPGVPNTLAGTMGELRNSHFHSGLDIRTNNQVGAAIRAANEGYISRVTKSSFGYGNVVYVTHPDGNTTLYAHLDSFKGPIESYVRKEQYKRKTFEIDLKFSPDQFRVNRGDTIALSGNTGGSTGPHLHFDLRDKDMNAINPLHYGFDEIKDKIPPMVLVVALRTMDQHSRINGKFGRFEFRAFKTGGKYRIPSVKAKGKIGIEILGIDKMDLSPFQCGINEYVLSANNTIIFRQNIDKIEMPITRAILSLMDHSVLENKGQRFNRLYVDDGNPLGFYSSLVNKGLVTVEIDPVKIGVSMKDSYGNTSELEFELKPDDSGTTIPSLDAIKTPAGFELSGNYLTARISKCAAHPLLFRNGESKELQSQYNSNLWSVYIIDVREGLPDSLVGCKQTLRFGIKDKIPSGKKFTFYGPSYTLFFPDSSLFDTLYFSSSHRREGSREVLTVADKTTALLFPAQFELRPLGEINEKYAAYRFEDGRNTFLSNKWVNGKIKFETNKLGKFVVQPDVTPPDVRRIYANQSTLRFRIWDNLSGIDSFEVTVDGEWILMNYDYKTGVLFSEKLDKTKPFKGTLILQVKDRVGNSRIFKQQIL